MEDLGTERVEDLETDKGNTCLNKHVYVLWPYESIIKTNYHMRKGKRVVPPKKPTKYSPYIYCGHIDKYEKEKFFIKSYWNNFGDTPGVFVHFCSFGAHRSMWVPLSICILEEHLPKYLNIFKNTMTKEIIEDPFLHKVYCKLVLKEVLFPVFKETLSHYFWKVRLEEMKNLYFAFLVLLAQWGVMLVPKDVYPSPLIPEKWPPCKRQRLFVQKNC